MDLLPMPAEYGAKGGSSSRCTGAGGAFRSLSRGWCWFRGLTGRNAGLLFGRPADGFFYSIPSWRRSFWLTGPVSCFTLHLKLELVLSVTSRPLAVLGCCATFGLSNFFGACLRWSFTLLVSGPTYLLPEGSGSFAGWFFFFGCSSRS